MSAIVNITQVNPNVRYWFVRSESGNHFDTFLDNDFIAIGWNEVTVHDLKKLPPEQVKAKISNVYGRPLDNRANRRYVTSVYNKLINFLEIKKGDIVCIPSENSSQLAFGIVISEGVFSDFDVVDDCKFSKRRSINWLTKGLDINSLDPSFLKIRKPWHAISEIAKEYQYYIDSVIFNLYKKDNNTHFVLRVTENSEINLLQLAKVLTSLTNLMQIVNDEFGLEEDVENSTIRINLQSPGLFNIKHFGASLGLVACLLGVQGCREQQSGEVIQRLDEIKNGQNALPIDSLTNDLVELGVKL